MWKEIKEWAIAIVIAVIIVAVVRQFLLTQFVVDGRSMSETFEGGDRVLVNKLAYKTGDVKHGDIVVFDSGEGEVYIKRVIGIPGDTVEMINKDVFVNGEKLDEPYISFHENSYKDNFTMKEMTKSETIPEGEYLVLGDNRPVSKDSREFGLIQEDKIIGKVFLRFWPLPELTTDFSQ